MFNLETRTGDPIAAGGVQLVSIARSMRLTFGHGAVIWNRPIGVSVTGGERPGETLVPIHDRTRRLQLAILGAGFLGSLLLALAGRRRRRAFPRGDGDG